MALVDYSLAQCGIVTATVPVDDSDIDAEGNIDPDARFEGPISITLSGPGAASVSVWQGDDGPDSGRNPWRTSESQYPGGITEDDSPIVVPTGGPVKKLSDVSWSLSYWTG